MRPLASLTMLAAACCAMALPASAGVTVTEKTTSYDISGRNGEALVQAMDRRGPRHGLLTRAIAQTRYALSWEIEWGESARACRVTRADGKLAITYAYPRVTSPMPPALKRRWSTFSVGVRKHEAMHGRIARQMAAAVEKSLLGISIKGDRGCRQAKREAKRRMAALYADYEARQIRFDEREHNAGGPVEKLILELQKAR